jgi:hypothetical protein
VTTSDNRLIVVRAWRDSDRLIIRVILSAGPTAPAVETVFTDVESASERLADVLRELLGPRSDLPGRDLDSAADTKR